MISRPHASTNVSHCRFVCSIPEVNIIIRNSIAGPRNGALIFTCGVVLNSECFNVDDLDHAGDDSTSEMCPSVSEIQL